MTRHRNRLQTAMLQWETSDGSIDGLDGIDTVEAVSIFAKIKASWKCIVVQDAPRKKKRRAKK